jgi:hypothetical protein
MHADLEVLRAARSILNREGIADLDSALDRLAFRPEILSVLVLSSSHLPLHVVKEGWLTGDPDIVADVQECGWWVYVPDDPRDVRDDQETEAIHHIFNRARQLDCDWLRFDHNGPVDPHLPVWED